MSGVDRVLGVLALAALLAMPPGIALAEDGEEEKPRVNAYEEFAKANRFVSYGGYTRAIPHYERALKADPVNYDIIHFNLGEVWRAKDKCGKAAFHYQAYLQVGRDPEALELSKKWLAKCKEEDWPTLTLDASATPGATFEVDGFVFSNESKVGPLVMPPGSYEVSVSANDYIPTTREVKLKRGGEVTEEIELEKKLFFGTTTITVNREGATLKLIPKKLDKPSHSVETIVKTSPHEEAIKLPTGKYLLEVTLEDHDRWIRHIYITRDNDSPVRVRLSKSLPDELR